MEETILDASRSATCRRQGRKRASSGELKEVCGMWTLTQHTQCGANPTGALQSIAVCTHEKLRSGDGFVNQRASPPLSVQTDCCGISARAANSWVAATLKLTLPGAPHPPLATHSPECLNFCGRWRAQGQESVRPRPPPSPAGFALMPVHTHYHPVCPRSSAERMHGGANRDDCEGTPCGIAGAACMGYERVRSRTTHRW